MTARAHVILVARHRRIAMVTVARRRVEVTIAVVLLGGGDRYLAGGVEAQVVALRAEHIDALLTREELWARGSVRRRLFSEIQHNVA